jgi:catechol 2,3-dioxygenase-like lactoylglutathione lyase family enzyme
MPKLNGILETALYTDDMARSRAFYEGVLELRPIFEDQRLCAYGVAEGSVNGGSIPGHDGKGPLHIAFAISKDEMPRWETQLKSRGVSIEGHTDWSRGGRSIYFRDPDGHLLEFATPGLWTVY